MNAQGENSRTKTGQHSRILVVDDEVSLGKGLQLALTDEGFTVDLALTGRSALDTFGKKDFDLVVADLRLPDIDGMEVVKQVKTSRPDVGVIVITGYSTVPTALNAMRLGAFDFLPKPFTTDEFMESVAGALKQRRESFMSAELPVEAGRLIEKGQVIMALERASVDAAFWRDLMERGSRALESYALSADAKAAIVSGDLRWICEHAGALTEEQRAWIGARLEQERW
jgi:DNA-binding response OmpR family regulator